MLGGGTVTVSCALALVWLPPALLTTTLKRVPLSARARGWCRIARRSGRGDRCPILLPLIRQRAGPARLPSEGRSLSALDALVGRLCHDARRRHRHCELRARARLAPPGIADNDAEARTAISQARGWCRIAGRAGRGDRCPILLPLVGQRAGPARHHSERRTLPNRDAPRGGLRGNYGGRGRRLRRDGAGRSRSSGSPRGIAAQLLVLNSHAARRSQSL